MLSKTKSKNAAIAARSAALPSIPKELIDLFVTGPMSGDAVHAASVAFKKALIERAMGAELSHHLGYPPGAGNREAQRLRRLRLMTTSNFIGCSIARSPGFVP